MNILLLEALILGLKHGYVFDGNQDIVDVNILSRFLNHLTVAEMVRNQTISNLDTFNDLCAGIIIARLFMFHVNAQDKIQSKQDKARTRILSI